MDISSKKIAYYALGTLVFSCLIAISSVTQANSANNALPSGEYLIKSTRGCSENPRWCAWLSWDGANSHMASVKRPRDGYAVPWEVRQVLGKPGIYTIHSLWDCPNEKWCRASLSWDGADNITKYGHPRASVETGDPVEWRIEAVSGKPRTYIIKSTRGCAPNDPEHEWCNATLSLDDGIPHIKVSVEKDEHVEWRFYDYGVAEDPVIESIVTYKMDKQLAQDSCADCNGKNYGKLTVAAYKSLDPVLPHYVIATWFATKQNGLNRNDALEQRQVKFSRNINQLYQLDAQAVRRLTLCILTRGEWANSPQGLADSSHAHAHAKWNGTDCE